MSRISNERLSGPASCPERPADAGHETNRLR